MSHPRIDPDACQGHGRCYHLAPAIFRPADDAGRTEVVPEVEITDRDRASLDRAVAACPEMAIDWAPDRRPDGRTANPASRRIQARTH